MKLPKTFTTVTTLSKIIALGLFFALPFIGFYLGYSYHKSLSLKDECSVPNASALIEDLVKHPELIPYKGVLGGTMGFYHKSAILPLSPEYVQAYFEDGHIAGHMLLRYKINPDGSIKWTVVNSDLN